MTVPINAALNAYARAAGTGAAPAQQAGMTKEAAGGGFGDFLNKAIQETVGTGKASETQIASTTAAKETSIVDVVTAVAEAETTLQTVVAIRDKVIAAYQDIMRMPI